MARATLEHINVTVSDPQATAELLCALFDWHVRWQGPSAMGGHTVHVGSDHEYLALYTPDSTPVSPLSRTAIGGLNHVGVVVPDLEQAESRVVDAGFRPHNHADYAPGRRFYFNDTDGIEYEVVSYS